ncbi:MAG: hypothetical protein HZB26_00055 [Candidatus Hydrogenedentes bacterium]|nr:hypothetical protein [Candidatus Hydrogenedentota bacterium]
MKLATCFSYALAALLALNASAQTPAAPAAAPSSANTPGDKAGSAKEAAAGKEVADKDDKNDAREEGKEKSKDKDKTPAQEAVKRAPLKGDVIRLKNGKILEGIRIIRATPREYQVEVAVTSDGQTPGVPISVSRNQVESVTYERDTEKENRDASENPVSVISGQRLSPELESKLSADLSKPPLQYTQTDLLKILGEVSQKTGVKIVADKSVEAIGEKDRAWDLATKEGATLSSFLNDDLVKRFPNLAVQIQFDSILIITKEAKDAAAKSSAPPA